MNRSIPTAVLAVSLLLVTVACGSGKTPPATTAPVTTSTTTTTRTTVTTTTRPPTTTAASTTAEPNSIALAQRFNLENSGAPWFTNVRSVELSGKAVLVYTASGKPAKADAKAMCEAARVAAKATTIDFVSVTVRSAGDSSISWWNKLRGDTACNV